MTEEPPSMLTRGEAAAILGLSREGLARKVRCGEIPEYRYGPRQSRVSEADVIAYMESKRRDPR